MNEAEREYIRMIRRREYDRHWKLQDLIFFTGLKKEFFLKKVAQGTIPYIKKWKTLFFAPDEIRSWLRDGIPRIEYHARGPQIPCNRLVKTEMPE